MKNLLKKIFQNKKIVSLGLTILSLITVLGITFAWFSGSIDRTGITINTGEIIVTADGYYYDEDNSTLSKVTCGLDDKLNIASIKLIEYGSSEDTYFIVSKDANSIDVDYRITVRLENDEGELVSEVITEDELTYVGGYWFKLSNITTDALAQTAASNVSLNEYENQLLGYVNYQRAGDIPNAADEYPLNMIEQYPLRGTLDAANMVNYYRLTYGYSNYEAQYTSKTIKLRASLYVAQKGALTEEDQLNARTWYVNGLADFRTAYQGYLPGDLIRISGNVSYNGDLVFRRPVNLKIVNATLEVYGNLIYSFPYVEDYTIDTSASGQILVRRIGATGGNFEIETPNAKVELIGKGGSTQLGDYFVQENITVNASYETGIYLTGVNFYGTTTSGEIPSNFDLVKTLFFKDATTIEVSENTVIESIRPYLTSSAATDNPRLVKIVNYGKIKEILLTSMTLDLSYTNIPQIFIDNFKDYGNSDADKIGLPQWSQKWVHDTENDTYSGNTRIVQEETSVNLSVNCTASPSNPNVFTDADIEVKVINTLVIDAYGDYRYITINYQDTEEKTHSLRTIMYDFYFGEDSTIDLTTKSRRLASEVLPKIESLTIRSFRSKALTDDDYTFIRSCSNLKILDLSQAVSPTLGSIQYMSKLEKFTMSNTTVEVPSSRFYGCSKLYEIYIPATVATLHKDFTYGGSLRYIHLKNTSYVYETLSGFTGVARYDCKLFVDPSLVDRYLAKYNAYGKYFPEAVWDYNKTCFYRQKEDGKYELVLQVNDFDVNNDIINVSTIQYSSTVSVDIDSIGDYALYWMPYSSTDKVIFGDTVKSIGRANFNKKTLDTVDCNNVETLGIYCFNEAVITTVITNHVKEVKAYACHKLSVTNYGFPELEKCTGNYNFAYTSFTGEVTFPKLVDCSESQWTFYNCDYMVRINCPELLKCNYADFCGNDRLEIIYCPKLSYFTTTSDYFYIFDSNPKLYLIYIGPIVNATGNRGYYYLFNSNARLKYVAICGTSAPAEFEVSTLSVDHTIASCPKFYGFICNTGLYADYVQGRFFTKNNFVQINGDAKDILFGVDDDPYYGPIGDYVTNWGECIYSIEDQFSKQAKIITCNRYSLEQGTYTVPGSFSYGGESYTVTTLARHSYYYMSIDHTDVIIPESITVAEYCAFYSDATYYKEFNSLTANGLITINQSAFAYTRIPGVVEFPEVRTLGAYAFNNCDVTIEFRLPKLETIGYQSFANMDLLEKIYIPNCKYVDAIDSDRHSIYVNPKLFEVYVGPILNSHYSNFINSNAKLTNIYVCGTTLSDDDLTNKSGNQWVYNSNASLRNIVICKDVYAVYSKRISAWGGQICQIDGDPADCFYTGTYYGAGDIYTTNFGEYVYNVHEGEATLVSCRLSLIDPTTLEGSATYSTPNEVTYGIDTVPVRTIGSRAYYYTAMSGIDLVIAENTTSILNYVFYSQQNYVKDLLSITASELLSIGNQSFRGVLLPGTLSLPKVETIGNYCFYDMDTTIEVSLPNLVTCGPYTFASMDKVEKIYCPSFTTVSENYGNAHYFYNNPKLYEIYIGVIYNYTNYYFIISNNQLRNIFICGTTFDTDRTFTSTSNGYFINSFNSSYTRFYLCKNIYSTLTASGKYLQDRGAYIYQTDFDPKDLIETTDYHGDSNQYTTDFGKYIYEIDNDNNVATIVSYLGEGLDNTTVPSGTYTVPAFEPTTNYPITKIGNRCYRFATINNIAVVVPDSVTEIGVAAFNNYSNQYAKNMTSFTANCVVTMGESCLNAARIPGELSFPELVTAGPYCFQNVDSTTSLYLPKLTTVGVGVIRDNDILERIYAPNLSYQLDATTGERQYISYNPRLFEIYIGVLKVFNGYYFIRDCQALKYMYICGTSLDVSELTTQGTTWTVNDSSRKRIYVNTNVYNILKDKYLKNYTCSAVDYDPALISGYGSYTGAANNLTSLSSLNFYLDNSDPSNPTATLVTMNDWEYSATEENNATLTIPSSVTKDGVTYTVKAIGQYAFAYTKMNNINLVLPSSIERLENYAIPGDWYGKNLVSLSAPGVKYMGNYALSYCYVPGTVDFPELLETGNYTFHNFNKTTILNLPKLTTVGNYFVYHCTALEKLYAPKVSVVSTGSTGNVPIVYDSDQLYEIYIGAFTSFSCDYLIRNSDKLRYIFICGTSVDASSISNYHYVYAEGGVTRIYVNEDVATVLKTKYLTNTNVTTIKGDPANLYAYGDDYYGDTSHTLTNNFKYYAFDLDNSDPANPRATLVYSRPKFVDTTTDTDRKVTIPSIVPYGGVNYKVVTVSDYAFYYTKITNLAYEFPNTVTTFGYASFNGQGYAKNLTSFTAPGVKTMGNSCLRQTYINGTLSLPQLVSIGPYCFYDLDKTTYLYLPELRTIGMEAISYCNLLEKLYAPKLDTIDSPYQYERYYIRNNDKLYEAYIGIMKNHQGYYLFIYNTKLRFIFICGTSVSASSISSQGTLYHINYDTQVIVNKNVYNVLKNYSLGSSLNNYISTVDGDPKNTSYEGDDYYGDSTTTYVTNFKKYVFVRNSVSATLVGVRQRTLNSTTEGGSTLTIPSAIISGQTSYPVTTIANNVFWFITISGIGISMPSVKELGYRCFASTTYSKSNITSFNAPELLTAGYDCFYQFGFPADVTIPKLTSIGSGGFYNCDTLVTISLPELVSCGYNSFYGSALLEKIYAPKLVNHTNYTTTGQYFVRECPKLVTVYMGPILDYQPTDHIFYDNDRLRYIFICGTNYNADRYVTVKSGYSFIASDNQFRRAFVNENLADISKNSVLKQVATSVTSVKGDPANIYEYGEYHGDSNEFTSNVGKFFYDLDNSNPANPVASLVYATPANLTTTTEGGSTIDIQPTITVNSVTYKVTKILPYAFRHCGFTGLALDLPNGTEICEYAFHVQGSYAKAFSSISMPLVTTIEQYAFYNCSATSSVFADSVTSIGDYSFYGFISNYISMNSLQTVGKYGFYGAKTDYLSALNITTIDNYGFQNSKFQSGANFPDLTSIGISAFNNCDSMVTFYAPNLTTTGYCSFYNNDLLEYFYAPKLSYYTGWTKVLNDQAVFRYCPKLYEAYIGVIYQAPTDNIFYDCAKLTLIYICGTSTTTNTTSYVAFNANSGNIVGNTPVKRIYVEDGVYQSSQNKFLSAHSAITTAIPCDAKDVYHYGIYYGNSDEYATNIGKYLFALDKHNLQAILLWTNVRTINATTAGGSTINIPDYIVATNLFGVTSQFFVTEIKPEAFRYTTILNVGLDLPYVKTIGDYAFHSDITNYPKTITSLNLPLVETIGNYAFHQCTLPATVSMPELVTMGYYAIYQCDTIVSLSMPKLETVGYGNFIYLDNIERLYAPNLHYYTPWSTNGDYRFGVTQCPKLVEAYIGVLYNTAMPSDFFNNCAALKYIYICGSSIDTNQTIGTSTNSGSTSFTWSCPNLKKIFINENVYPSILNKFISNSTSFQGNFITLTHGDPKDITKLGTYVSGTNINLGKEYVDIDKVNNNAYIVNYEPTTITDRTYIVPESITIGDDEYPIVGIANKAYNSTAIRTQSLFVPSSITSIGSYAFGNAGNSFYMCDIVGAEIISDNAFSAKTIRILNLDGDISYLGTKSFDNLMSCMITILKNDAVIPANNAFGTGTGNTLMVHGSIYSAYQAVAPWNGIPLASITTFSGMYYDPQTTLNFIYSTLDDGTISIEYISGTCSTGTVTIYDTIDGFNVSVVSGNAFFGTNNVTSISIGANVKVFEIDFDYLPTGLQSFTVARGNTQYFAIDGVLYNQDQSILLAYPTGKTDTTISLPSSVRTIGSHAFYKNTSLETVVFNSNQVCIMDYAFAGCYDQLVLDFSNTTVPANFIGQYIFKEVNNYKILVPSSYVHVFLNTTFVDVDIRNHIYDVNSHA